MGYRHKEIESVKGCNTFERRRENLTTPEFFKIQIRGEGEGYETRWLNISKEELDAIQTYLGYKEDGIMVNES